MKRLCERLAGLNALVGMVALVLGLAMLPQAAQAAAPDCQGQTCTARWLFLEQLCETGPGCISPCGCQAVIVIDPYTGLPIDCIRPECLRSVVGV